MVVVCDALGKVDDDDDPTTPCAATTGVAVAAEITLTIDIATIQPGTPERQAFED